MKTHRLEFRNEDDGTITIMVVGPGHADLNTFFDAATKNFIDPHLLALQLGRLGEEREREIMMRAYACGVVLGTEPDMSENEVYAWFKSHPGEFDILFEIADHRKNFEDDGNPNEHGQDAEAAEPGGEGAQ